MYIVFIQSYHCFRNILKRISYSNSFTFFIRILESIKDGGNEEKSTCEFPFEYEGIEYVTCTTYKADYSWCSTEVDENGVAVYDKWEICSPDCEGSMDEIVLHCLYAIYISSHL